MSDFLTDARLSNILALSKEERRAIAALPDELMVQSVTWTPEQARFELSRHSFAWYLRECKTDEGKFPLHWPVIQNIAAAFDSDLDLTILKRRQTLMSWILACYADWEARFHENSDVGITSIGKDDVVEFLRKMKKATFKIIPNWMNGTSGNLDVRFQTEWALYPRAGLVKGFASTTVAGVGRTQSAFIMDEAAKHEYGEDNLQAVYPALYKIKPSVDCPICEGAGHLASTICWRCAGKAQIPDPRRRGRMVISSTSHPRDGRAGFFYNQWVRACGAQDESEWDSRAFWPERETFPEWLARETARQRKTPSVCPIFMSRWCRPDQPREGPGSEWLALENERMASAAEKYGDAMSVDVYYPTSPSMAFSGRAGLVYGRDPEDGTLIFDPALNVQRPDARWIDCYWRIVAIDPGGADPTGIVGLGVFDIPGPPSPNAQNNHLRRQRHIYKALCIKKVMSVDEIEAILRDWNAEGMITRIYVGETGGATITETLRARGWPAYKASMERAHIGHVASMFKSRILTIEPGEVEREIGSEVSRYRYRETGGPWATDIDGDCHGEILDGIRYACAGVLTSLPQAGGKPIIRPTQIGRPTIHTTRIGANGGLRQVGRKP